MPYESLKPRVNGLVWLDREAGANTFTIQQKKWNNVCLNRWHICINVRGCELESICKWQIVMKLMKEIFVNSSGNQKMTLTFNL